MIAKQERESNIEVLRFLAMFLIVIGHQATHGFDVAKLACNAAGTFTIAMSQGARIAVDIFVLITGYYSVDQTIKWKKVFTLYRQVWFYSVSVLLIVSLCFCRQLTINEILKYVFPIYTSQFWFASCFLFLMLLLPYINILVSNIDRHQHMTLLVILLVPFCIVPTIIPINTSLYSHLFWFIVLVLVASYIRLYSPPWISKIKCWHGMLMLVSIMVCTSTLWGVNRSEYVRHNAIYLLAEPNKLSALVCAMLFFIGFKNTDMGRKRWFNSISANVFAVYLITDHPQMRKFIFTPVTSRIEADYYPLLYIGWALCLMIVCIIIEMIRLRIDKSIFKKAND